VPARSLGGYRGAPRLLAWCVAAGVAVVPACAFLDKVDKVSKIPGLEQVQATEGLDNTSDPLPENAPASSLRARPSALDFGRVSLGATSQQTVVISNPSAFAVTLVHVTVRGCGFAVVDPPADPPVIPAVGEWVFAVTFQPAERRACSGFVLLEIDSAGGRFITVSLTGRGS
jgi:hypothetical protein